jgi:ribose 5-phosphate isomerase A
MNEDKGAAADAQNPQSTIYNLQSAIEKYKQAAASAAVTLVEDGMALGLGTGTTARLLLPLLAARIANEGLRLTCVPTSDQTAQLARSLNIPITTLEQQPNLDLTIDGADEILPGSLSLIKGRGGALLREKIVALSSKRLVIVADESKVVEWLGEHQPLPVEVIPFGWHRAAARLEQLGGNSQLREVTINGGYYRTDNGNYILDCHFGAIADPTALERNIKLISGVVESGLFVGIAKMAIVAGAAGVKTMINEQ